MDSEVRPPLFLLAKVRGSIPLPGMVSLMTRDARVRGGVRGLGFLLRAIPKHKYLKNIYFSVRVFGSFDVVPWYPERGLFRDVRPRVSHLLMFLTNRNHVGYRAAHYKRFLPPAEEFP